jgi:recombination protein RecR
VDEQPAGVMARLMAELGKLPGIGPKTAERLAHHLLSAPRAEVIALSDALRAIKDQVKRCTRCQAPTEHELCETCRDSGRDASLICVVEQPRDMTAMERSGTFRGLYHVLHGKLSPLDGIGPEHLTIDSLVARVRGGGVREVVMATNPTTEGDGTALYISTLLAPFGVKVTRLARGLPSGSGLEFANNQMLADAFEGRRSF